MNFINTKVGNRKNKARPAAFYFLIFFAFGSADGTDISNGKDLQRYGWSTL